MRGFTHYPCGFLDLDHFAVTQLIIELKDFIVAVNFYLASNEIIRNVEFKLNVRNHDFN